MAEEQQRSGTPQPIWQTIQAEHYPWRPLASLICPPCGDEALHAQLIQHGCELQPQDDLLLVIFPPGTLTQPMLPRRMEERWRIKLPDGILLMRQVLRHRQDPAYDLKSLLFVL